MTLRTRKKILIMLVIAFVVIGTSAALYAQGYRVDLADFSFQKVGGIYVRSFPKAAVYLDDELIKEDFWFFQNGVLMNDLFPRKYEVRLVNENYEDWKQTIEVEPSLVSELKFAVLIPKTRTTLSFATSVRDFWIGEDSLITNTSGTINFAGKSIPGTQILEQDHDSNNLLLLDAQKNFYIYNYNSNSSTSLASILRNLDLPLTSKISLDQGSSNVILATRNRIYILNLSSLRVTEVSEATSTTEISPITISRTHLAWTQFDNNKNSSSLVVYNKDARTKTIYPAPFSGKTMQIEFRGERIGILQNDGSFYYGNPFGNSIDKISSDVLEFRFMDDNSRIALRGKRILELIPLKNLATEEYLSFELANPEDIKSMRWYKDGRHIFINYSGKTMFLDIDDKYLEHYYEVAKGKSEYDPKTNQLYSLLGGTLTRLDFAE